MKLRVILIILAIIIAGVAVVGVIAYTTNIKQTAEQEVEKIEVLVAVQNIPKDTFVEELISANSVQLVAIPRKYIADGVLTTLDDYKGFVTISPISTGEQITTTKFVKPELVGLAFNLSKDMVAISIPVDRISAVSNLIRIGDMVNVIATFTDLEISSAENQTTAAAETTTAAAETTAVSTQAPETTQETQTITKTLLWNVKVLYLGTREITAEEQKTLGSTILSNQAAKSSGGVISINTATLALSVADAEKLVFTEQMGSVWLVLVPAGGIEAKEGPGSTFKNIFGQQ
jgi:Flp pilus assembly protein CpaB